MQVSGIAILSGTAGASFRQVNPSRRAHQSFLVYYYLYIVAHSILHPHPHLIFFRIPRLFASTGVLMSPYILDFDRPVTHSSLLLSWLYETCKKGIENTCESAAVNFQGDVLLTMSDSPCSLPTSP